MMQKTTVNISVTFPQQHAQIIARTVERMQYAEIFRTPKIRTFDPVLLMVCLMVL